MKKIKVIRWFVLIACSFYFVSMAQGLPTPPSGKKWVEVSELTDEFDSWNSSKWWKPLWNYGEPVQMLAGNSGVTDGKLWIKATLDSGAARWFETSRVMSYEQISYPMYTECSMKTAHISAYNTFWLNNGDSNNRDEFDICENNSKPSYTSQTYRPYTMYSQYFIVVAGDVERNAGDFDNRNLSAGNPLKGVKWNEAYHTLGAWWIDENNIQFYLDGEPAGSVTTSRDFTRDLNIIWDLWTIDATWSGGIANQADLLDDNINTMYVDWIHTYELVDDTVASTPPMIAWTQITGSNMVMHVTNGIPSGSFDLLSSTSLTNPLASWVTSQSGLQFDGAGEAMVTNPVSESREFFRVGDLSTYATFDWSETAGSGRSKWDGGPYIETDNGVTMTTDGRIFTADGQPYAIKYAYDNAIHDHLPGTFTMEQGGGAVNFIVTSIDISQDSGTSAGTTKYVQGKLGTTVQWEIVAPEDGVLRTYTTATTGDMGLEIDTIVWHAGWKTTGDAYGIESTIDNLSVRVPSP